MHQALNGCVHAKHHRGVCHQLMMLVHEGRAGKLMHHQSPVLPRRELGV